MPQSPTIDGLAVLLWLVALWFVFTPRKKPESVKVRCTTKADLPEGFFEKGGGPL